MRVLSLLLRDFRVHHALELSLGEDVLLVGANGVGKTSVLEGLHIVAVGRSFRRVPDEQVVRRGASLMEACAEAEWGGERHRVECRVAPGVGKRVHVDGRVVARLGDLVEATSVVTTTNEDVMLVEGSPAHARRWLDLFACQREPGLLAMMVRYVNVLRQRNALLAQAHDDPSMPLRDALEPWDTQMFELGSQIETRRIALVQAVERMVGGLYGQVAGRDAEVRLRYQPGIRVGSLEGLRGVLRREVARGYSLWGPHRAGMEVTVDGLSSKAYASRGEKRTIAFALKIAQGRLMRESPICLLDDVALELDAARSSAVVRMFMEVGQVVATSARAESAGPAGLMVVNLEGGRG